MGFNIKEKKKSKFKKCSKCGCETTLMICICGNILYKEDEKEKKKKELE